MQAVFETNQDCISHLSKVEPKVKKIISWFGHCFEFVTYPSERSELRYGVWGLGNHVVRSLSPPRGLHWEGYKVSHMVKVSALHVTLEVG